MKYSALLLDWHRRIETSLIAHLPTLETAPQQLHQAMHYAISNGGKRLRPLLVYLSCDALGGDITQAEHAACAVEYIHSYSLVHDDLPAMDNDDMRRGKPSCHVAFDEATAMLVGDALHSLAFDCLSQSHVDDASIVKMIRILAHGSGSLGMAGGQAIDLAAVGKTLSLSELQTMHQLKTGALIAASMQLGAIIAGANSAQLESIEQAALHMGLAFQIQDDLLDKYGDAETIGKPTGSDAEQDKPTYVNYYSESDAHQEVVRLYDTCAQRLQESASQPQHLLEVIETLKSRTT